MVQDGPRRSHRSILNGPLCVYFHSQTRSTVRLKGNVVRDRSTKYELGINLIVLQIVLPSKLSAALSCHSV